MSRKKGASAKSDPSTGDSPVLSQQSTGSDDIALKEIAKRLKESQTQKDREDEAAHCKKMKLDMVKMGASKKQAFAQALADLDTAHHQFLEELAIHEDAVRATLVSLGQEELFTKTIVDMIARHHDHEQLRSACQAEALQRTMQSCVDALADIRILEESCA